MRARSKKRGEAVTRMSSQSVNNNGIPDSRAHSEQQRDLLAELARIHLTVDTPTRVMPTGEPDWVGRLRKIQFHVRAICYWDVTVDTVHVMAPEIRAAYKQLDAVWEQLPKEEWPANIEFDLWGREASDDVLAAYTHPTPTRLMLSSEYGGLYDGDSDLVYLQLSRWLGHLAFGYGLALTHLSKKLGSETKTTPLIVSVLNSLGEIFDAYRRYSPTQE